VTSPETPDVRRLREALASLAGSDDAPPAVDSERIFDALHGRLSDEERRAVVEELVRSPDAAEAWRFARELSPADRQADAPSRRLWLGLSIAAAALLAVTLGWQFSDTLRTREEPVYRSVEQRRIESLLPPEQSLPRSMPVLRWTPIEGARYRVRVLTPALEVLEEADELTKPEHALDANVVRRLPAGQQILWQVEASVAGEAQLVSPTFSVRLE
jgi:hypothetical protein